MKCFKQYSVLGVTALLATAATAQLQSSHRPTIAAPAATVSASPAQSGRAVARVNGAPISELSFEQEMRRVFPYSSMHGNAIPKEYLDEVRKKALNNLIDSELFYQEAKRRKLEVTPAEWRQRLALIRKDYRTQAEFDADTKRLFGTRQAFETKLRHDMLLDKLFLIEVKRKAVVTDAAVQKMYEANKANFVQPESVSFQTISAMFPKNATAEQKQAARARIEKMLAQAQAAKDYEAFGILAEKVSEDEYRVMMGDHKMVHRGSVTKEFESVFTMKEGAMSGIVESAAGYHILRVYKHQPKKQLTFAEVRASVRDQMQKERLAARNKEFHEALRKAAKVEIL